MSSRVSRAGPPWVAPCSTGASDDGRECASVEDLSTSAAPDLDALRPIERRVLRLVDSGLDNDEIGQRFRRSTGHIERLIELAHLPGRAAPPLRPGLRPLERCILGWRAKGASHEEIAPRLGHSSDFVARVEDLARHKLDEG